MSTWMEKQVERFGWGADDPAEGVFNLPRRGYPRESWKRDLRENVADSRRARESAAPSRLNRVGREVEQQIYSEGRYGEPRGNAAIIFRADMLAIRNALKRGDCVKARRLLKDTTRAMTQIDHGPQGGQRLETKKDKKRVRAMLRGLGAKLSKTCRRDSR